jgi:outer membrane protein TolC
MTPMPVALKELKDNDQWKMATPSDALIKGNWWEAFGDPQLNRLEELVNVNNQNIKQAEAQFRQARAFVAANHANYYPAIGSSPSITQLDAGTHAGRGTAAGVPLPALHEFSGTGAAQRRGIAAPWPDAAGPDPLQAVADGADGDGH